MYVITCSNYRQNYVYACLLGIYIYAIWSCVIIITSHSTIETFYSLCNSVYSISPVCCKLILLEETLQLVPFT